eukprot:SAG31_NODE_2944_length_4874_cov_30.998953_7_plen_93_part_00
MAGPKTRHQPLPYALREAGVARVEAAVQKSESVMLRRRNNLYLVRIPSDDSISSAGVAPQAPAAPVAASIPCHFHWPGAEALKRSIILFSCV